MAGATRLELATSGVTGRRSNQTELRPRCFSYFPNFVWWAEQGLNLWPTACKAAALPTELPARNSILYLLHFSCERVTEQGLNRDLPVL